jgi:hypothetical protein
MDRSLFALILAAAFGVGLLIVGLVSVEMARIITDYEPNCDEICRPMTVCSSTPTECVCSEKGPYEMLSCPGRR